MVHSIGDHGGSGTARPRAGSLLIPLGPWGRFPTWDTAEPRDSERVGVKTGRGRRTRPKLLGRWFHPDGSTSSDHGVDSCTQCGGTHELDGGDV